MKKILDLSKKLKLTNPYSGKAITNNNIINPLLVKEILDNFFPHSDKPKKSDRDSLIISIRYDNNLMK